MVTLTPYYNNKAFGLEPGEAAFDPLNQSYAAPALAIGNGSYRSVSTGIEYRFQGYREGNLSDNIICDEQVISLPAADYFSVNFLVAADVELKAVSANMTFGYTDNTTSAFELRSEDGIFIHWGPYSVSGWGNSTPFESYAEWFWWYSTHHPLADRSDFYDYRLRTFGPHWNYDDSFADYTATNYDPKAWVDLFADAGAQYFVVTTKHHDGFALFDTGATTARSALHYGPKRDILKELFDAAATYQPHLRRGTYFSLSEWFNPDFQPYGFAQFPTNSTTDWPGVLARNPYTGLEEPYTGRIPIDDFITDLMVPQMEILAHNYGTDVMWCDCGAANGTADFAAKWFNKARDEGRSVAIHSRCGIAKTADFGTPEYTTFSTAQRRKWESNEGMDPYSYGYNRATNDSSYMNATSLIGYLVDIVSKNGNFLLDIGPRADGSIVEAEVNTLREAGKWINSHAEAIFNTTYWFIAPESQDGSLRFTQTNDAFYILALEKPTADEKFVVNEPVPILEADIITIVGPGDTAALDWKKSEDGSLEIEVPAKITEAEQYCWIFKICYEV